MLWDIAPGHMLIKPYQKLDGVSQYQHHGVQILGEEALGPE